MPIETIGAPRGGLRGAAGAPSGPPFGDAFAWVPLTALEYAEKVRSQSLSLRHPLIADASDQMFVKSPCRPIPLLKRAAPLTPSLKIASTPFAHSRFSASRTGMPYVSTTERRSARTAS